VTVLGTAFNVRAGEAATRVALVHGRVRVEAGDATAELTPGEAVTAAPGAVTAPAVADVARATAWQRGAVSFDGEPLGAVLDALARGYGVAFTPAPGTPLDARVSVYYTDRPALPTLLGDLGAATGVRFVRTADGYAVRPVPPAARRSA
jgi:transmembrane sensor